MDYFALKELPGALRVDGSKWSVTVGLWMGKEIVRFLPGKVEDYYGIAIDMGTTTCAAYFCNLRTKEVIGTSSMMNPQCKYGEDVMARITYHMMNEDGLERMSADMIEGLNSLIQKCCDETHPPLKKDKETKEMVEAPEEGKTYLRLKPSDLVDMTLVGNTAMHHICLGLDPEPVGLAPFPAGHSPQHGH